MLSFLKDQFQASVALNTRLFDEGVERQVKFATEMMNIGVESGKQIRSCKNLTDVVDAQKSYLESVKAEVTTLSTGTAAALKELGSSANDAVTTVVQAVKAKASKQEATSDKEAAKAAASKQETTSDKEAAKAAASKQETTSDKETAKAAASKQETTSDEEATKAAANKKKTA